MPKLISIDLDGVLNTYDGIFDETKIPKIKMEQKNFFIN